MNELALFAGGGGGILGGKLTDFEREARPMVKHMKGNPLSATMRRAVEMAQANGGRLIQKTTGMWEAEAGYGYAYFHNPTIQALVDRGLAEYTAWQPNRGPWNFPDVPVEVTLTERAGDAGA